MGLFQLLNKEKVEAFKDIPGPTPSWPLGTMGSLLKDTLAGKKIWEITSGYAEEYGELTLIWNFGKPTLIPNDPSYFTEMLVEHPTNFYKASPCEALIPLTTKSNPFVVNGAAWKKARENAPFSQDWFQEWLDSRIPLVTTHALACAEDLKGARPVDLMPKMQRITFDLFCIAILGHALPDIAYDAFVRMGKTGASRISKGSNKMPPPLNPMFYLARNEWRDFWMGCVKEALKTPDDGNDLIRASLRNGVPLTNRKLALSMGNIYFGGGFSAASAIATNLYCLSNNPEAMKRVKDELNGQVDADCDAAKIQSFVELEKSLLESLRYLTPVPFYSRHSRLGVEVPFGKHTLPSDTTVWISNWYLQRHSKHWENGDAYNPQRWTPEKIDENPIGSDYFFPFGRGTRSCMGQQFALTIMRATLAAFWSELDIEVNGNYKQGFYFGVMMPKGLWFKAS